MERQGWVASTINDFLDMLGAWDTS